MKSTVNFSEFCDAFHKSERDNFSYEGLRALFDYLEQYEEDCGEEIELDVIALCCDYTEYDNLKEFQDDYGTEYEDIEDIETNTTVIKIDDDKFIIQAF
jgi:hypothetical protein